MTLSLTILKQGSSTGPCTGGDYAASPGAIVGALIALNGIVVGSAHAEAGTSPKPYVDYVDDVDQVWLSDWGSNSVVTFNPTTETFEVFPIPTSNGLVRQILGRPGEI